MRRAQRLVWVFLAGAVAGCGGALASSPDDGGTSGDAAFGPDAGDAGTPLDAGPAPDATPLGSIMFQRDDTQNSGTGSFYAAFSANAQQAMGACTQQTTMGSCVAYTCPTSGPQGAPYVSAGTLTIAGGPFGTGVTVAQDPSLGAYSYTSNTGFSPGDVLSVSASGGQVPAFGTLSIVAPGPITLLAPQPSSTIPTQQDLTWSWSGGASGDEVLVEAMANISTKEVLTTCRFDAATGSGTMPSVLLQPMQGQGGMLFFGQERLTKFSAGPYPVQLGAIRFATEPATYQ